MGHAFQDYSSRHKAALEYLIPTAEAGEIHSMSLEFLAYPQYERFFGDDATRFRAQHLSLQLLMLPYIAAIDEFQELRLRRAGRERRASAARCGSRLERTVPAVAQLRRHPAHRRGRAVAAPAPRLRVSVLLHRLRAGDVLRAAAVVALARRSCRRARDLRRAVRARRRAAVSQPRGVRRAAVTVRAGRSRRRRARSRREFFA